jgi:glutathione S-transferase
MSIQLYVFPPSPRAFKVTVIANYLGLDTTLQFIDLIKGDQKSPEYAAINPNMRMPALKDGDYVLWESNAIMQYLAAKKPDSGLLPVSERDRLDVTRWQFWDLAHWDPACTALLFEYIIKPIILKGGEPDPAAVAKGNEAFHRVATVLDGHLKNRKFITGNSLTVADFSLGAPLNYTEMAHFPLDGYGEIKRWFATLSALPAWRKTQEQSAPPPLQQAEQRLAS